MMASPMGSDRGYFLSVLMAAIGLVIQGTLCGNLHPGLGPPAVGLGKENTAAIAGGVVRKIAFKDYWWEEEEEEEEEEDGKSLHIRMREEASKAVQAASSAVPRSIHPAPSSVPCNKCGLEMERRASRYGPFYGCKGVRTDSRTL